MAPTGPPGERGGAGAWTRPPSTCRRRPLPRFPLSRCSKTVPAAVMGAQSEHMHFTPVISWGHLTTLFLPPSAEDGVKALWPTVLVCLGPKCLPGYGASRATTENRDMWVTLDQRHLPSNGISPQQRQHAARTGQAVCPCAPFLGGTSPSARLPANPLRSYSQVCPRRHPWHEFIVFPSSPMEKTFHSPISQHV